MDSVTALINQFATAHPYYFAAIASVGGFFAKSFIFTKENARWVIKKWFDKQRAALKKAGRSDAEIQSVMKEEADFIMSAAQEAEDEATASPAPQPVP